MAAVAATFTIWTNRSVLPGGSSLNTLYGAGVNQNDNHQRRSNADARYPKVYGDFEPTYRHTRLWTGANGFYNDWLTAPAASAELSGTIVSGVTEADIVAGGKTLIITLANDTWLAAGAPFDGQRQNIINGCDSDLSEATGWDLVVKALQGVAGVVRTSNTVVTITWDAQATYDITALETITCTVPGTALNGALSVVATPAFAVDMVATHVANALMMMGSGL